MGEGLTAQEFHDSDGVEDWRVLATGATAFFRGSYADGVALVRAIGDLAAGLGATPAVDLRPDGVTVTVPLHPALAREVSAAARDLGLTADPSAVQEVQLTVDTASPGTALPFWRAVLGYDVRGEEDLVDPRGRGPSLWFQELPEHRRLHVDVFLPHDLAEARADAALAAGGRLVQDRFAPAWRTLADPEGRLVDLATWQGRG